MWLRFVPSPDLIRTPPPVLYTPAPARVSVLAARECGAVWWAPAKANHPVLIRPNPKG